MNDKWNAFVDEEVVLESAGSGRLDDLKFTVKDVFAIKGYKNTAGNPDWYRTHEPAASNAPAIDKLLQQGATLRGTAHTDEIMYSLNGENHHYGTPVNPVDADRIPGGSSSGSAVAVSAGLVDFALGTDTGGSVRIPSSYCGIFGIRPTHGAVPIEGVIPLAEKFDTVGWFARNSKLLIEVGDCLIDGQQGDGDFRHIYLGEDAWALLDEGSEARLSKFVPLLESAGDTCTWHKVSKEGLSVWANAFRIIQGIDIWQAHGDWIQTEKPTFGPGIADRFQWTSTLKKRESENEYQLKEQVAERLSNLLGDEGVLVIPTAPGVAPLKDLHGEKAEHYRARAMQLTCIAGLAGLPQVTIPVKKDGLPIGLSFIANRNQDRRLLRWVNDFVAKHL